MSHFTSIKTQITDIAALRSACQELNLNLREKGRARGYNGRHHKGDWVIVLPGPYDIALNQQPDGAFGLTTDWWGGSVAQAVGENYGKLLQLYGVHKASAEARKRGLSVARQARTDGSIKLVLTGVGL